MRPKIVDKLNNYFGSTDWQGGGESESSEGAGFTPAVFYALGSGSVGLGTALGTVPLDTPAFEDTGYSLSNNQITIGSELDGKRAKITWAVAGGGAANRVEIRSELQLDPTGSGSFSRIKGSSNYTARNTAQAQGGVQGIHFVTLADGNVFQIQALRDGSTANLIADETHISIETLS